MTGRVTCAAAAAREEALLTESVSSELQAEQSRRQEADGQLAGLRDQLGQQTAKNRQMVTALQTQLQEQGTAKVRFTRRTQLQEQGHGQGEVYTADPAVGAGHRAKVRFTRRRPAARVGHGQGEVYTADPAAGAGHGQGEVYTVTSIFGRNTFLSMQVNVSSTLPSVEYAADADLVNCSGAFRSGVVMTPKVLLPCNFSRQCSSSNLVGI